LGLCNYIALFFSLKERERAGLLQMRSSGQVGAGGGGGDGVILSFSLCTPDCCV